MLTFKISLDKIFPLSRDFFFYFSIPMEDLNMISSIPKTFNSLTASLALFLNRILFTCSIIGSDTSYLQFLRLS